MNKLLKLLIVTLSFVSVTNCISRFSVQEQNTEIVNNPLVERELLGAAQSIERSLGTLAATQQTNTPPLLNTAPLVTPEGGMGGTADIDWTGPIEPLLRKLTTMTDYNLKVLGREPAIPVIVSITQNKAVIADIMKNAGLQAGKKADIKVFPASRIVELRYRG